MKTSNYIILVLSIVTSFISCKSPELITIGTVSQELASPPMTEKIDYNFYADNQEISNLDYLEFTFWVKKIFGEDSQEYKDMLPKTEIWGKFKNLKTYNEKYFASKDFEYHPVVGISKKQALSYTKWRTDRVAEMILISKKYIKTFPDQNKENYFTIDKYKSSQKYEWLIKRQNVILPIYKLPTETEWVRIAKRSYAIQKSNLTNKKNKKVFSLYGEMHNLKELNQKLGSIGPMNVNSLVIDNYGLHNIIGNVSEIVMEEGVAKGGNWLSPKNESSIASNNKFEEPNCWTGMRNICSWELIELE